MGFFSGTEEDSSTVDSKCVVFFPEIVKQTKQIYTKIGMDLLIPTHFVGWLNDIASLVSKYSAWQSYCTFGTLFGVLDNALSSYEGLTMVLFQYVNDHIEINKEANKLLQSNQEGN